MGKDVNKYEWKGNLIVLLYLYLLWLVPGYDQLLVLNCHETQEDKND